jgi:hypothetical protein
VNQVFASRFCTTVWTPVNLVSVSLFCTTVGIPSVPRFCVTFFASRFCTTVWTPRESHFCVTVLHHSLHPENHGFAKPSRAPQAIYFVKGHDTHHHLTRRQGGQGYGYQISHSEQLNQSTLINQPDQERPRKPISSYILLVDLSRSAF